MRLGWLADYGGYKGGAELVSDLLQQHAPPNFEIVPCPVLNMREDVDAYIIHNSASYDADIISLLEQKPVVKQLHDVYPHGDKVLRDWLMEHSTLVIASSPLHVDALGFTVKAPLTILPPATEVRRRKNLALRDACWVGRYEIGKGIPAAIMWAVNNDCDLHMYGFGTLEDEVIRMGYHFGHLGVDQVPDTLAQYKRYVFLPDRVEPFGRGVAEAYFAGCELVLNERVGAKYWLEENPAALKDSIGLFWNAVCTSLNAPSS